MSKPHFAKSLTSFCRLADDDLDDGLVQPRGLGGQLLRFLRQRGTDSLITRHLGPRVLGLRRPANGGRLVLPSRNDPLEHSGTGHLVDAHQHRLARLPSGRAMLDEIGGDLVQPLVGGDDLVVLAQQLVEKRRLVGIEFGLLDFRRDAVVQVGPRHAELLAPVLVDELDGGAVLLGPLEVVARDVIPEDALRDLVLPEQRRAGEADEGRVRQREAHVARQPARLCAMRLVGDDDDVVALAVGLLRIDILVELVDQAEDVAVALLQPLFQVVAGCGPGRIVVGDTAADEGPVNLAVEIVSVGHQQEREVAFQLPPHLLREEGHGIGLAAALGVPEHPEPTEFGMRPLDNVDWSRGNVGRRRRFGDHRQCRQVLRRRTRFKWEFHDAMPQALPGRELPFQFFLARHGCHRPVDPPVPGGFSR